MWAWWPEVNTLRDIGVSGPGKISRVELQAWERDLGFYLDAWERRALLTLDRLYLTAYYQARKSDG